MYRAFTLLELLVVIGIIGILSCMILVPVEWSRRKAKEDRTRALVAQIDRALQVEWERLYTQRLPCSRPRFLVTLPDGTRTEDLGALRKWRGNARRDLVRMELPDRWSDIGPSLVDFPLVLPQYTNRARSWQRLYRMAVDRSSLEQVQSWESAELLYLITEESLYAGELNVPGDYTGDIDGDGLREYWDAWGTPICFVRWPAPRAGTSVQGSLGPISTDTGLVGEGVDDSRHILGPYPLILSAGPDGVFDINRGTMPGSGGEPTTYAYRLDEHENLNPWTLDEHDPPHRIGEPLDGTAPDGSPPNGHLEHFDNITNRGAP